MVLVPSNCTVAGGARRGVDVILSEYTAVPLDVTCTPAVRLPKIAYAAEEPGGIVRSLEVVNPDGTGATRLTGGDAPAWSPDGKALAFSNARCIDDFYYGMFCSGGIQMVDPEIGNVRPFAGGLSGFHPSWASNGSRIVFHDLVPNGVVVLKELAVLASVSTTLNIMGPRAVSQPAVSPDGKSIAFACQWPTSMDLCIANADGSGVVRLTDDAELDQEPAWSPDGTKLAFARHPIGRGDDGSAEIAVMDLATRRITMLGGGADPAWSPDGSKLVFAAVDGLFVMNADGSDRIRLTTGAHHAPAWRP
jgi:TolB protein